MKRARATLILALLCSAPALAAGPGYQLSCLPDGAPSLADNLNMRFELHGWHAVTTQPDYKVCLRLRQRQQLSYDPSGPVYGPYWGPPTYREVEIPYLELVVTGKDGQQWQGQQDLGDGDKPAQRIEEGARQLIDRLPW